MLEFEALGLDKVWVEEDKLLCIGFQTTERRWERTVPQARCVFAGKGSVYVAVVLLPERALTLFTA